MSHHSHPQYDTAGAAVDKAALLQRLRQILPQDALLSEAEDLHPYECDGLSAYCKLLMQVALPSTIEQVQAILRICHELQALMVVRSAVRVRGPLKDP